MARLVRFWKPWGVLTQFTDREGRPTLADFISVPDVYAAGRLDMDSEGLLLLTDSGALATCIAAPRSHMRKHYLALVEGTPSSAAMGALRRGIALKDGAARALAVEVVPAPALPERDPPPVPRPGRQTAWVRIVVDEGRNRMVRRMLAHVGAPVLRLVRDRIGDFSLQGLSPGAWVMETLHAPSNPNLSRTSRTRPSQPQPHDRRHVTRSSGRRRSGVPSSRKRRGS